MENIGRGFLFLVSFSMGITNTGVIEVNTFVTSAKVQKKYISENSILFHNL